MGEGVIAAIQAKIDAPLTGRTHGAWDRGRIDGLRNALAIIRDSEALAIASTVVEGDAQKLREALRDLVSWFPEDGPTVYGPWIIKAGKYGADDAVAAARAALGDDA